MSVVDSDVVDAIGLDNKDGCVVLTISDHLGWQEEATHLQVLQQKLIRYAEFVNSGELLERYAKGTGRRVRVEIVAKEDYPESAQALLERIGEYYGIEVSMRTI